MYAFGAPGFLLFPHFFKPFTPFTLLFTSFVFLIHQPYNKWFMISFMAVCSIGFVAEVIGVKTGWVFGTYHYGNALGYKYAGVPLVISLNWALLAASSLIVAQRISKSPIAAACLAALLATGIDVIIEQVAPHLDFWYFKTGLAGWHNYLGWVCLSLGVGLIFHKPFAKGNYKIAACMLVLQVYFFGCLVLCR